MDIFSEGGDFLVCLFDYVREFSGLHSPYQRSIILAVGADVCWFRNFGVNFHGVKSVRSLILCDILYLGLRVVFDLTGCDFIPPMGVGMV